MQNFCRRHLTQLEKLLNFPEYEDNFCERIYDIFKAKQILSIQNKSIFLSNIRIIGV